MRNCSLSWSKHENNKTVAALNTVNLEVRPGSLIGVVGFVGSGKSSLLAGILGDMHVFGGAIKCTVCGQHLVTGVMRIATRFS